MENQGAVGSPFEVESEGRRQALREGLGVVGAERSGDPQLADGTVGEAYPPPAAAVCLANGLCQGSVVELEHR